MSDRALNVIPDLPLRTVREGASLAAGDASRTARSGRVSPDPRSRPSAPLTSEQRAQLADIHEGIYPLEQDMAELVVALDDRCNQLDRRLKNCHRNNVYWRKKVRLGSTRLEQRILQLEVETDRWRRRAHRLEHSRDGWKRKAQVIA